MRANRILNNTLITFSVIIFIVSCYLLFLYVKNESNRVYFEVSSITDANWKSGNNSLSIDGSILTLVINDEKIVNNKRFKLDNNTGKITIGNDDTVIYLRSVGEDAIVIWYKEAEYRLNREVIYR